MDIFSEDRMNTYLEWEDGIKFEVRENKTALVCGALAIAFALFILAMRFLYPSIAGGGVLLYLPLLCMLAGGVACFLLYFNRKLIVEEMDICYVNWIKRERHFALDEIGYCKIGVRSDINRVLLYGLVGDILCKLSFEMQGMAEFCQYLVDNGVRVECIKSEVHQASGLWYIIDMIVKETAVCEEEIGKCSQRFYEEVSQIFFEWQQRNKHFEAVWEFGFAEYTAQDLERKRPLHMYPSSMAESPEHIPESYECVLEAYLKRGDGYVVTNRGGTVNIMLPYLSKTRSYQIGEKTRIRKTDEESMKAWLRWKLESFDKELPRHRYHTEDLVMGHKLRTSAGIAEKL